MAPRLIRFEERFIECYSLELSLSSALGSIIHRRGDVSTLLIQTKQLCMHRSWLCAIPKTRRWKFVRAHGLLLVDRRNASDSWSSRDMQEAAQLQNKQWCLSIGWLELQPLPL